MNNNTNPITYQPAVRQIADNSAPRPMNAGLAAIVKASREGIDWVGEYHDRFMPKG